MVPDPNPEPDEARSHLISFCLSTLPNEVSFDRADRLADAFRAEVEREVRAEIAAERAALQARLNRVLDICDREQRNAMRWENPIPVPEWVAEVQRAALGDDVRKGGATS